MATQFTLYTSSDVSGPGLLTGQVGTLIALLKACLVDGYAGHANVGWTQPVATASNIGSFKPGAGSGMTLLVNDNAPNVTPAAREAWVTGWESLATVGAPVGTGSGQFPTPAQQLTTGHGVMRKSNTADAVGRAWFLYADTVTFYLFVFTGDGTYYRALFFGDIFAMKGATDSYRCLLAAGQSENAAGTEANDTLAAINTAVAGHFMPRSYGGVGTSITAGKHGDSVKGSSTNLLGTTQYPNGPDNALYMSPIWIHENASSTVRGRLRGMYQVCHATANFTDGQTFVGAGDYAGKSFRILKPSVNLGHYCIETSATVEIN